MPQLVGLPCVLCQQRIDSILTGRFCPGCHQPVHIRCIRPEAQKGDAGKCPDCGADRVPATGGPQRQDHQPRTDERPPPSTARSSTLGRSAVGCLWQLLGLALIPLGLLLKVVALQGGLLGALIVGVFVMVCLCGGVAAYNWGRRHRTPRAEEVLRRDPRPPVLYLRSFQADTLAGARPADPLFGLTDSVAIATEEEQLGAVLSEIGPFVALGRPGDKLPLLGAARSYVKDDDWQARVSELMAQARLVVLRLGTTPGFWWELQQARHLLTPAQVLVAIPCAGKAYQALQERSREYLPHPLPDFSSKTRCGDLCGFVTFESDWTPQFLEIQNVSASRKTLRRPLVPPLKMTLRPIFERLGVAWEPPPIATVRWAAFGAILILALLGLLLALGAALRPHAGEDYHREPMDDGQQTGSGISELGALEALEQARKASTVVPADQDQWADALRLPEEDALKLWDRSKLKAQVWKINEGKSSLREVVHGGSRLKVGDTARLRRNEWVEVMNLTPVASANNRFVFRERGDTDRCVVQPGGSITLLGFTEDRLCALVEYRLPEGEFAGGTAAPSGTQFFLAVSRFARLKNAASASK